MIIVIDRPYLKNYEAMLSSNQIFDYDIANKDDLYLGGAKCVELEFDEKKDYRKALDLKKKLLLN